MQQHSLPTPALDDAAESSPAIVSEALELSLEELATVTGGGFATDSPLY